MKQCYFLNYELYENSDHELSVWDGADVTIQFQIGAFAKDGAKGAIKPDDTGTQWITLATVDANRVKSDPELLFINWAGVTDFFPAPYFRLRFSDPATNEKITDWQLLDFAEKLLLFLKMKDTTDSIGITAYWQAKDRE